jgi:hypothetical protein
MYTYSVFPCHLRCALFDRATKRPRLFGKSGAVCGGEWEKWWIVGLGMLRVLQGCYLAQRSHAAKEDVVPAWQGKSSGADIKLNIADKASWFCLRRRSGCLTFRVWCRSIPQGAMHYTHCCVFVFYFLFFFQRWGSHTL